jgi:diguanylate cyclase (GGDEF)-like protein/PAS domain S-box-containing protein
MRTSEQITAEIEEKLGFIPPFFGSAQQNPEILENLWQQTLSAYLNNPLSALFKEKLLAYLSRYCAVPYCMICHSCSLRPLGVKAREVLELLESPLPTETDIDEHLSVLALTLGMLTVLPELNSAFEESLLYCSIFIVLQGDEAEYCRQELRRILGPSTYNHLVTFIAYVKTCHAWMEAHPEVAYEADKRVQDNLGALLEDEPGLADFFRNYSDRVRRERQIWAERLVQIAERKRAKALLRAKVVEAAKLELEKEITQRQRVEEELSESQRKLTRLIDSLPGIVFSCTNDPEWSMRYLSEGCLSLTGYRSDELVGNGVVSFNSITHAEDLPKVLDAITAAIALKQPYVVEYRIHTKSGQEKWLWEKGSGVFDELGDVLGLEGFITDITERKRAEEALRQQTERELLVSEIGQRIRSSLSLEEVLSTTVSEVRQLLASERVFIYRFEPDWNGVVVVESVDPLWPPILAAQTKDSYFVKTGGRERYKQGCIHAIADIYTAGLSQCHIDLLAQLQVRANLVVPILQREELWGLLIANHCSGPRQWQQVEINLLKQLATQVGIAIQQSELYQQVQTELKERKRAESQLLYNAFHDPLTGLPNRALFMNRLEHALEHAERHEDYLFAVLFLDLDRFKVINDSLGHLLGDQLLVAIAGRLEACLRPTDTAARLGGDEFTLLLEDIRDVGDAIRVAERIQVELTLPFDLGGQEVFTSASIGIALSSTGYNRPEDLLRDADIAMYRAKALLQTRYEVFDTDMHDRAVALLQVETQLRQALERQELRIHYQPIVSLFTGRITGFEALVRWQHPDHGLLYPLEFMAVAVETGLIVPIDQWVLREACRQTQQWQELFPDKQPLTISVNLCNPQFRQPELLRHIKQVLQETKLDARSLKLEITENIIMENDEFATARLLQLRALGIQLSIDDFGTGYSSLGRLHSFPIDVLKIDSSFVSKIGADEGNLEITETIVTLAHKLGVDVIAEGVERAEQLTQLRGLKCEYGQGYFFSEPLDSKAAEALIVAKTQW